jgi:hypothetical protein
MLFRACRGDLIEHLIGHLIETGKIPINFALNSGRTIEDRALWQDDVLEA